MNACPSVLCPVDFSDGSAGALRYAAAIAGHLSVPLVVLTVEDPLLTEATDVGTGVLWSRGECEAEMQSFAARTFGAESPVLARLEYVSRSAHPPLRRCGLHASARACSS